MERVGDAFVWPFRDPRWAEKIVIIGLIGLIPIVGGINTLGWLLATVDRLRAGEEELPPGNFDYLLRGLELFVVMLVYVLIVLAAAALFFIPGLIVLGAEGSSSGNGFAAFLGVLLMLAAFAITTVGLLLFNFARPAIVLAVDRGGISAGFDLPAIVRRFTAHPANTLIAGLMLIAAGFIGGLGAYLCFIGIVLTLPYSIAMEAWIVRSYELGSQREEGLNVGKPAAPAG